MSRGFPGLTKAKSKHVIFILGWAQTIWIKVGKKSVCVCIGVEIDTDMEKAANKHLS